MNKKQSLIQTFVLGFAVFAIFFGAGNLIFPPYLGLESGKSWFPGFLAFSAVDIGMAVVTVIAIIRGGGEAVSLFTHLGKRTAVILTGVAIICVGPLIAIPRTCSTTFDMSISTLFPSVNSVVFSIIYFVIVLILALRPSKIVDIIGRFLTPALLVSMLILIIKNVIDPIGAIKPGIGPSAVKEGFLQGYQTLDVLGAVCITSVIVASLRDKGITERKPMVKTASMASLIAAIGLFVTYAGLCYLGATASTTYNAADFTQPELIVTLSQNVLGFAGYVILAMMVLFACLTTAIGLVSASSDYLAKVTKNKIPYKVWAVIICIFDAVIANMGTAAIISTAAPVLNLIYPLVLTQVILHYFDKWINTDAIYRGAAIGAILCSSLSLVDDLLLHKGFTKQIPLAQIGLEWMLFALSGMVIGYVISKGRKKAAVR